MIRDLRVIYYPDPRLKKLSTPVDVFDPSLAELATRMLELMREHRGVGLAAPQVGYNIRMFVMNPTQQPGDDRVYVNPELLDPSGSETAEEGCLSIPNVNCEVQRSQSVTLHAFDLQGNPIEESATGYLARIWQHEVDHLNGVLITDRMGMTAKMLARRTLKELEEKYAAANSRPAPKRSKKSKAKARR